MLTDPILQQLVKKYPVPKFEDRSAFLYEDLIESIVSQQLSIKAADTIFGRFKALFGHEKSKGVTEVGDPRNSSAASKMSYASLGGNDWQDPAKIQNFPSPKEILAKSDDELRSAGLSYQKASYIKAIAHAFANKDIDPKKIQKLSDEEIIIELTKIRGVGKWTAEMILIFTLQRPDVFSLGDLGIRRAISKLYGITDPSEMLVLSENWQPYRSTACWYLWRSLENG